MGIFDMTWYYWLAIAIGISILLIARWLNNNCSGGYQPIVDELNDDNPPNDSGVPDIPIRIPPPSPPVKSFGEIYVEQVINGYEPALNALPKQGERWKHRNGLVYEIIAIANIKHIHELHPITVVYKGITNGHIWTRKLSDWHSSMILDKLK